MSPVDIVPDSPNSTTARSEVLGKNRIDRLIPHHFLDLKNYFIGEPRSSISLSNHAGIAKNGVRVLNILLSRNPFKVFTSVVRFDSVFMIHFVAIRMPGNKRARHKPVYSYVLSDAGAKKNHMEIAVSIRARLQNSINRLSATIAGVVTFHSSECAYGVIRELFDCFPNLITVINCIRHAWPFSIRLRLFRCAWWPNLPSSVPKLNCPKRPSQLKGDLYA